MIQVIIKITKLCAWFYIYLSTKTMIHFEIEFLICFTNPKEVIKKGPKKKTPKQTKSQKDKQKSKKTSNSDKVQETLLPEITDKSITIDAIDSCHIEYCVLDEILPVIEINVATWGAGANVFVEDYNLLVDTEVNDDFVWINFTIHHEINEFEDENIIKFKNNPISVTISQNLAKVINVNENWQEQFKISRKSSNQSHPTGKQFSESDLLENNFFGGINIYDAVNRENDDKINQSTTNKVRLVQVLPLKEVVKQNIQQINQILKKFSKEEVITKKATKATKYKKEINTKKGPKSASKSISRAGEVARLSLRTEDLIAGKPDIFLEQQTTGSSIKYVGIYVKSSNILTDKQNLEFLPLIVSIKSVEDLPLLFLEEFNFKNIYAQYELANVLQSIVTERYPIQEKDVLIEDTKVFFLSGPEERLLDGIKPSMLRLQEALSTCMMVVKLYGERNWSELPLEGCLFGEKKSDQFISMPGHEIFLNYKNLPKTEPEFLCSASFKLIQLLDGFPQVETSSVLTSAPVSTWKPTSEWNFFGEDGWNDERKSLLKTLSPKGQIPDSVLLKSCARITIRVSSPCDLKHLSLNDQLLIPNIYHRVVLIFKTQELAFDFFKKIQNLNDALLDLMSDFISHEHISMQDIEQAEEYGSNKSLYKGSFSQFRNSFLDSVMKMSEKTTSLSPLNKIITGFFIDNKQECILVLEGSPYLFIEVNEILCSMILPKDGKIMLDSSLFFTRRLYADFFPLMNIFYIQLKTPIDTLLQQVSHYLFRNISELSVQALFQLDMIRRSPTLDCIAVNQLFPSYEQLISFNISFGVTDTSDYLSISAPNMN